MASCGGKTIEDKREEEGDVCYLLSETSEEIKGKGFQCGTYNNAYDARQDGYRIVQTACNYSIASGNPTKVWTPGIGLSAIEGGAPSYNYFNHMALTYDACGHSKPAIVALGADCGCHECWVYWGK